MGSRPGKFLRSCRDGSLALALVLITVVPAWAAPVSDKLSYPQFVALVQHKVSEIPDLQVLWKNPNVGHRVQFTGGAFRGLLLWIHAKLQKHSFQQVWDMQTPWIDSLLLQKDADRDLLASDKLERYIRGIGYSGWDILSEGFFQLSTADGGAGLDRAAISPTSIRDDLGGLKEFYYGRLNLRYPHASHLPGNTPMALALRYLRFAKEFESAAQPDAEALEAIKLIGIQAELPRNTVPTFHDPDSTKYWIKKALVKFVNAYQKDYVGAFVRLKELQLLRPLGSQYYFAGDIPITNGAKFVRQLAQRGLDPIEIAWVGALSLQYSGGGYRYDQAIDFARELRKLARNDTEERALPQMIMRPGANSYLQDRITREVVNAPAKAAPGAARARFCERMLEHLAAAPGTPADRAMQGKLLKTLAVAGGGAAAIVGGDAMMKKLTEGAVDAWVDTDRQRH